VSQCLECKNPVPQQGNLKLAPCNTSSSPVFTRCSWWFLLNWCLVIDVKCWLIQHLSILEAEQLFFNYRKNANFLCNLDWRKGPILHCVPMGICSNDCCGLCDTVTCQFLQIVLLLSKMISPLAARHTHVLCVKNTWMMYNWSGML